MDQRSAALCSNFNLFIRNPGYALIRSDYGLNASLVHGRAIAIGYTAMYDGSIAANCFANLGLEAAQSRL